MNKRMIDGAGVKLAVRERGDADQPTIVLIHGYPDTQTVWNPVAEKLASRFHVVTYDVRGQGGSTAPGQKSGYEMALLMADLGAVIDNTAPGKRVHLVGHDWGSLQGWEAASTERAESLASYTSISGPSLDHAAHWMRKRLARPTPRHLAELSQQLRRSSYVLALCTRRGPERIWRSLADKWPGYLMRREGVAVDDEHPAPTLAQDGINGARLYADNIPRRLRRPRPDPIAHVPVQVIIAERDRYLSPRLCGEVERWVPLLRTRSVDAGHWVIRTEPGIVADHIADFISETRSRAQAFAAARR